MATTKEKKEIRFIIKRDNTQIEMALSPIKNSRDTFNNLIDCMNELGYPITDGDIEKIVTKGVDKFIGEKQVRGMEVSIGNLKLKESALINMVERPNTSKADAIVNVIKSGYIDNSISKLTFKDGKYEISSDVEKSIVDQHTIYAKNNRQILLFKKLQSLAQGINEVRKECDPGFGTNYMSGPDDMFLWDGSNFSVDIDQLLKVDI